MRLPVLLAAAALLPAAAAAQVAVRSPDGRNVVTVQVVQGRLTWRLDRDNRAILLPSAVGFEFRGAPTLRDSIRITDSTRASHDEWWTQPWGEVTQVHDHHNELAVSAIETRAPGRRFVLRVRAFDDGVGFRVEFPAQPALRDFVLTDELSEFSFADDPKAWWIPFNVPRMDRSEMLYSSSRLSRLDSVQTPLTIEWTDGHTALMIHEADLSDYARMNLVGPVMQGRTLRSSLSRMADGSAVTGRTPFQTPWRYVQVAEGITRLAPSLIGLNLNPPNVLPETDWIRPMKYVGIWWGMHLGLETWSSGPRHGATTANAKRYIDFAAANGFGGVLIEGWNVGWDGDWIANRNDFSFTRAYPDYDLREVARYAQSKGIRLIVHNETSGGIWNYERQMDSAYTLYQSLGLDAIKSGYVTDTLDGGHSHWSQFMVRHHRRAIETAARHRIALDAHEPLHDTGERRTWPNMMSREGARGQEYNAWGGEGGNPPEHETILFFTRLLAGPMDFTPGIFDLQLRRVNNGQPRRGDEPHVRTTLAKQLALYVVIYSPMQMAADLPENYEGNPAFQFIRDVAVDWDTTRVIDGAIGDFVVVARRQRGAQTWFVGGITDENGRTVNVPLNFLPRGRSYVAEIYADGPGARWDTNPTPVTITSRPVTSATTLRMVLAPGGGQAIRIRPASMPGHAPQPAVPAAPPVGPQHTTRPGVSILDTAFAMPQLGGRTRRVWVYTPPDYATSGKRYPVLYMLDGQNVFDDATSYVGEWGVDETLDSLHAAGDFGAIVVAVDNGQQLRSNEYMPWPGANQFAGIGGGEGERMLDFYAQTLKPFIDARYRTQPGREATGIGGSSLGGLFAVYAAMKYPDVFGRVLALSPAVFVNPQLYTMVRQAQPRRPATRFWLQSGLNEGSGQMGLPEHPYAIVHRTLIDSLGAAGFDTTEVRSLLPTNAEHNERTWRREFPAAYRWLFR